MELIFRRIWRLVALALLVVSVWTFARGLVAGDWGLWKDAMFWGLCAEFFDRMSRDKHEAGEREGQS